MDFKSLQLFNHLALSLHFGRTSDAMYVSPSTLSRAIQRLESECGAELFVRDNRSVKLTAAGKRLLEFSQPMLVDWAVTKAELQQSDRLLSGELKLFCSVTASFSHLPDLLARYAELYPQVEIHLTTGDPSAAEEAVLRGLADLAIAVKTPESSQDLHFVEMDILPLVLITPTSSKITQLSQIDWTRKSMVLPEAGPSKRIVHHWLAEQGIRPKIYASVAGHEAIVSMVALGCGIGIVPKIVVEHSVAANRVHQIALSDIEPFHLNMCCLQSRQSEPLIQALLAQI